MQTEDRNAGIIPFEAHFRDQVLSIWEASVRATHGFLAAEDIAFYKSVVESIDFGALQLYCLLIDGIPVGFIAVADAKVEMLFMAPEYSGRGLGRRLLEFACSELGATQVDVNEQNARALRFYETYGFRTHSRSERDDSGRPYPILHMRLQMPDSAL